MSQFWSQLVHTLTPYVPGEQPKGDSLIKLNTNENPYPPSPSVHTAINTQLAADKLRLYPDPNADLLKSALAKTYQLSEQQVFVGNGSDEVLAHAFLALLKQDQAILFPDISYSFYPVYCGLYEIDYETIPLDKDFAINPEDYQKPNGGIIFPNPNAPTGRLLTLDAIERILKYNPDSVVVVDEAYIDFGGVSASALINQYPNLLVVQTFSKSRSLAGLRVGYALGHVDLIEALERVKNSFNSYPLDQLAIVGAVAALEDNDYFKSCCQQIIKTRQTLTEFLQQQGFEVLPSAANFVFARHPHYDAAKLANQLREQSIIVRHFKHGRIDQFLRITIGTDAQNKRLCDVIGSLISNP
ncbi:histidinol-phosphate transaminase [Hydrogenovibrio sp. SC-1]|uniref:histidinol-phosphate transaminase n=1 Tax=Hydrogenovibrio sp. SC-1 TaxID=2065820 RepID=UPI000C7C1E24|nr:histidinol-phosphate transaminase [Hydrogenovibrio sp. SC-1]PLA75166.1 histidinol-phosphate transaminase [Hydrogenovibrio sp. SC-1]